MTAIFCHYHPGAPAELRCDGCQHPLCATCVEESHRLLLCRHCGERVLPLVEGSGATVQERRRRKRIEAPYSLHDVALYAFRGQGAWLLWAYVLLLGTLDLFPLGCFAFLAQGMVSLILPGLLFAIARETTRGEVEMPDWPDFFDYGQRFGEVLIFLGILLVSIIPVGLALAAVGCTALEVLQGWGCRLPFLAGSLLGAFFWVPAIGSTAAYQSYSVTFRVDLHLRALIAGDQEALKICSAAALLFAGCFFLSSVVVGIPYLLGFLFHLIQAYTLFTSAHLAGLLFRRHESSLDPIYLG